MSNFSLKNTGHVVSPPNDGIYVNLGQGENHIGPLNHKELRDKFLAHEFSLATYVWFEGLGDWVTIAEINGFEDLAGQSESNLDLYRDPEEIYQDDQAGEELIGVVPEKPTIIARIKSFFSSLSWGSEELYKGPNAFLPQKFTEQQFIKQQQEEEEEEELARQKELEREQIIDRVKQFQKEQKMEGRGTKPDFDSKKPNLRITKGFVDRKKKNRLDLLFLAIIIGTLAYYKPFLTEFYREKGGFSGIWSWFQESGGFPWLLDKFIEYILHLWSQVSSYLGIAGN